MRCVTAREYLTKVVQKDEKRMGFEWKEPSRICPHNSKFILAELDSTGIIRYISNQTCRKDDANLKKICSNVYGIFVSVLQAAQKQSSDEAAQRVFFENNLNRIPSGWRIARQKAEERGDTMRLVQEDVKLAAIDEIWQLFRELWG